MHTITKLVWEIGVEALFFIVFTMVVISAGFVYVKDHPYVTRKTCEGKYCKRPRTFGA